MLKCIYFFNYNDYDTYPGGFDVDALVAEVHPGDDDGHLPWTLESQDVRLLQQENMHTNMTRCFIQSQDLFHLIPQNLLELSQIF